jgi:predicted metal-dependent phosphoesterase TrpH
MLRVEFHSHTIYSKDSLTTPEKLLLTCQKKGIHKIVVTDHNSTRGALEAKKLDPERVIVGEEIMTQEGELLAFYVKEEIPKGLSPMEAIATLRDQGAFISVSHPFDIMRKGHWNESMLLDILPHIDAIEIFNARCYRASFNQHAQDFAQKNNIPGTAGSDAHALFEIGRASMILPDFHDTQSLKSALQDARIDAKLSSPFVHFTSRYAVWRKMLKR